MIYIIAPNNILASSVAKILKLENWRYVHRIEQLRGLGSGNTVLIYRDHDEEVEPEYTSELAMLERVGVHIFHVVRGLN